MIFVATKRESPTVLVQFVFFNRCDRTQAKVPKLEVSSKRILPYILPGPLVFVSTENTNKKKTHTHYKSALNNQKDLN